MFTESDSGARCAILAFRNFDDALASQNPILRQIIDTETQDNGSSTETQRFYRGSGRQLLSTITVGYDADAGELGFQVETPDERQSIVIGPDGVPSQFELVRGDNTISFVFDPLGEIADVLTNGESVPEVELWNLLVEAASKSLANLREYQGLPIPFVPSSESTVNRGNGNGNGGNGSGTYDDAVTLVSTQVPAGDSVDDSENEDGEDDDDGVDDAEDDDEYDEAEPTPTELIATLGQGGDGSRQAHIDLVALARGPQGAPVLQELFDAYADAEGPQADRLLQVVSGALLSPNQRVRLVERLAQMAQPDNPLSQSASRALAALTARQLNRNDTLAESSGQELNRLLEGCGPSHDAIRDQLRSEFDLTTAEGVRDLARLAQRSQSWDCPRLSECLQEILKQVLTDNSLEGLEPDSEDYAGRLPLYREALAHMIVNGNLDEARIRELPGMPTERVNEFLEQVLQAPEGSSAQEQARIDYARLFAQGGLANVLENGYELPAERYRALLNEASQHLLREAGRSPMTGQQAGAVI
ncbi:MAG: hypothetical protein K2Z81_01335, partial [Cyanobacteria bacterium]|nr:hypothetical protein [Cyanobacteriota bacterium]